MKKSIDKPVKPVQEKKPEIPSPRKPDKAKPAIHREMDETDEKKIRPASFPQREPEHEDHKQLLRPYLEADKRTYAGDPW